MINSENEIHSVLISKDQSEKISDHGRRIVSETSLDLEVAEPPSQPEKKKCRLILKEHTITEANQSEHISSIPSLLTNYMASKVCPVCKTFSSTSNTTLKVHVDQCLSVESNAKRAVINVPKLKVKPRKKRLMVDIYATAPHCSLEDLDRRNGSSWDFKMALLATNCASESTFVPLSNEVSFEAKRPKLSPEDIKHYENKGAVYVNSNGIKLRILSKFNDAQQFVSRKDFKLRKNMKNTKVNETYLISKKRCFGSKHMKAKLQRNRSCFLMKSRGQIQAAQKADCHADNHVEKEESKAQQDIASDLGKGSGYATLRHWVCSKSSNLSRKIKKDLQRSSDSKQANHVMKLSELCENSTSQKIKRTDDLCNTTKNIDSEKDSLKSPCFSSRWSSEGGSSGNGRLLRCSRSTLKVVSTPRSRREEIYKENILQTSKSSQLSLEVNKSTTLKSFIMEAKKENGIEKQTITKRSRKLRHRLGAGKGEPPSDFNKKLHGSTRDVCLDDPISTKAIRISRSNTILRGEAGEILDQSSPISSTVFGTNQERKGMQIEPMFSADIDTRCTTVSAETIIPEKINPASHAWLSLEEHIKPICERETMNEMVEPTSLDEKEMQFGDATRNEIFATNIQRAREVKFMEEDGSSKIQDAECHTSVCIGRHIDCSTSPTKVGHEIPQENSSITSAGSVSCQDHKAIDRETSGSPLSTFSTRSYPSLKDIGKDSEAKPSDTAAGVQVNLSSRSPNDLEMPAMASIRKTKEASLARRNKKAMAAPLFKEPQQLVNDQPSCCSRRDNIPRDCGLLTVAVIPKDTSNPSPSAKTDMAAISNMELPTSSVDFSSSSPSPRTQTLLRLMGKNLIVSSEQSAQLPALASCNPLNSRLTSTGTVLNQESCLYNQSHQFPDCSAVFVQVPLSSNHQMQMGDFSGDLHTGLRAKPDHWTHPKKLSNNLNTTTTCIMEEMGAGYRQGQNPTTSQSPPIITKEVTDIHDSPKNVSELGYSLLSPPTSTVPSSPTSNAIPQRSISCFQPQNQLLANQILSGSTISFSTRTKANIVMGECSSDGSTWPPSRHLLFSAPSSGHLTQPLHYSQILH